MTDSAGGLPDELWNAPQQARREEMFPRLANDQLARLTRLGSERTVAFGELLFQPGQTDIPFYVILDGQLEIVHNTASPEEVLAVQGPGEFIGDVDMLSGRPVVVGARARVASRVLVIERDRLNSLVQTDPDVGDIILRAFILRRMEEIARGQGNLVLVGSHHSAETLRLQDFLSRNNRPYSFLDVDRDPAVQKLLDRLKVTVDDIPLLLCSGQKVLKHPTIEEVAACCGLNRLRHDTVHDVVIVGAGPSGLATALYGASEGLDVVMLEAIAPGGQAGTSSKIENYLGFPTGISGHSLASRAYVQAEKFGAQLSIAQSARRLGCERRPYRVELGDGQAVEARTVVIASGVRYRVPEVPGIERFDGSGIYFAATPIEATVCGREEVAIIGGGNSAGQAAVFLSRSVAKVYMLIRGEGLAASMSRYLIRRIEETPNIELRTHTQLVAVEGDAHLERIVCMNTQNNQRTTLNVRHVFIMTGGDANTAWLDGSLILDDKGFVKTGGDLTRDDLKGAGWRLERPPHRFETSIAHVFAVGDVRGGSVKRVSAAVGEGAGCVQLIHAALGE
jgi:thioredoxin reductase (NADPH)